MRYTASGRHPIHIPGTNLAHRAQTIAMFERTREQICHRGERDMRMGPHVDAMIRFELDWAHVIEEDEGTHHLASLERQYPAHDKTAQVALPGVDQL
jgi:hypothetical protein